MKQIDEFAPALHKALKPSHDVLTRDDVEAMAAKLVGQAQASLRPAAPRTQTRGRPVVRSWVPRTAFAVAAGVSLAGLLMWYTPAHPERVSAEYVTQPAQTMTIDLPTGSSVRLAPASRLQYRVTDDGATIVSLQGQAFFTVQNSAGAHFQVRTGNVVTTVLGTEFDVRYYDTHAPVTVEVASGKVSSGTHGKDIVLTPGVRGVLTDSTAVAIPLDNRLVAGSWRNGQLVFRNTPLADVLAEASRWSGYEFRLADSSMATQRVTTVLVIDTPATTLRLLKSLLNVTMTFNENIVTLSPRRQAAAPAPRRTTPRDYPLALEMGK